MTEIYLHIVARMADYMDTHPYECNWMQLTQPYHSHFVHRPARARFMTADDRLTSSSDNSSLVQLAAAGNSDTGAADQQPSMSSSVVQSARPSMMIRLVVYI